MGLAPFRIEPASLLLTEEPEKFTIRFAVGASEGWDMPVASWLVTDLRDVALPSLDFHTLVLHRGGAPVTRVGRLPGNNVATVGTLGLQRAGMPQTWHADAQVAFDHVYLQPSFLARLAAETAEIAVSGELVETGLVVDGPRLVAMVREYLDRAVDRRLPPSAIEMDARAVLIGLELIRSHSAESHRLKDPKTRVSALPPWRLARVRDYIETHLDGPIRLDELAGIAEQSPYHFSRSFKAAVGVGPHRYVQQRRLALARRLLVEGDLPLAAVALACGFANQSHFTTVFKAAMGVTPGRFRRDRGP